MLHKPVKVFKCLTKIKIEVNYIYCNIEVRKTKTNHFKRITDSDIFIFLNM